MPSSPPHEPRFGFLDAMDRDRGAPSERSLADVARANVPGIARIAEDAVALIGTERSGLPKEQEARMQNRMLRLSIQRRVDPGEIRSRILSSIRETHGEDVAHRTSEMLQNIEVGIHGTLAAIDTLRANFHSARGDHPDMQQLIATNDTLDAKRKIDLIEVRYTPGIPVTINEIRFVQSKARAAPSATEQKAILEAHREYYSEILTVPEVEDRERRREAEEQIARELSKFIETFTIADANQRLELALQHHGDAIDSLLNSPVPLQESSLVTAAERHRVPIAWFNIFFRKPTSRILVTHIADISAYAPSGRAQWESHAEAMRSWAAQREPSAQELIALNPDWHLSERFHGASSFVSITIVSGIMTKRQRIDQSGSPPKALTAAK